MAQSQNWISQGSYLTNPKLSQKFRHYSQPLMAFRQVVREEPVKGGAAGETVNFNKRTNLSQEYAVRPISELSRMPETNWAIRQGTVTIDEYGIAVPYTDKLERLSEYDPKSETLSALRDHMAKTINYLIYTEACRTRYKYVPGVGWDTDGTLNSATPQNTTVGASHFIAIKNYLVDTLHAPSWQNRSNGNFEYLCICSETFLNQLRLDTDIKAALNYSYMGAREANPNISGVMGNWNGFLFVKDNQCIKNNVGANQYLVGEALIFADDAIIEKTAMAPQIIAKQPEDYGRDMGVAWRGIFGYQMVWGDTAEDVTANQGRVIHVTSA